MSQMFMTSSELDTN